MMSDGQWQISEHKGAAPGLRALGTCQGQDENVC